MSEYVNDHSDPLESGQLADNWFYCVFAVNRSASTKYVFSVGCRYSDEYNQKAGLPGLGAHSTDNQEYDSVESAKQGVLRFFAAVQQRPGYPYPDGMNFSSI